MKRILLLLAFLLCTGLSAFAQKQIIRTDGAPQPVGPYSQGVVAQGLLFVAGQVGLDPATRKLVEGGLEKEVPQIMENIKAILAAHGMDMTHVVNTTIFMKNLAQFEKVNDLYASYFTRDFPARTTVGVDAIPAGGAIEIAVVAVVPFRKRKK
ncbi:Rid family detoxifying hydrolase [Salmonirosea aquatica]|uniref:RidA family protein n=1 Tax=Salmonirosea aquatica TaxID=2654236 RepID=A0A7C9BIS1_9BACT|nr:RidA family protein [Cytophagaceae bacterium SJW1-29]